MSRVIVEKYAKYRFKELNRVGEAGISTERLNVMEDCVIVILRDSCMHNAENLIMKGLGYKLNEEFTDKLNESLENSKKENFIKQVCCRFEGKGKVYVYSISYEKLDKIYEKLK